MSYLEELLPEFRKGAKIRRKYWGDYDFVEISDFEKVLFLQIKNWKLLTGNFIKSLLTGNYIKTLLIGITSSKIDAFVGFGMTKMMKILSPDWKLLIWMTIICALKAKTVLRGEIVALSTKMK